MAIPLFFRILCSCSCFFISIIAAAAMEEKLGILSPGTKDTLIIKTAITGNHISSEWKDALQSRMLKQTIDSFGRLKRPLSSDEMDWKKLIESKAVSWNGYKDSLSIPFPGINLNDTIFVMLGYFGVDDGFTYESQTVCLDVTALLRAYGKAGLEENHDRIDRIFAHEYTHLLHKAWAIKNKVSLANFKDSILWECLYEGMGMYRSLNPKWLPVGGSLPTITTEALAGLYPVFTDRMKTILSAASLTRAEKEKLNANLSRGQVNKKWGAFPVAIWLALEAMENPGHLKLWLNKGPDAVLLLALKYLSPVYIKDLESLQANPNR